MIHIKSQKNELNANSDTELLVCFYFNLLEKVANT